MKLLSPNYLACVQGTEELGSVGTGWGGESERLMSVKRKFNWLVCFKKDSEEKKHPATAESTHSLLKCSKSQTGIYSQHFQALNMKQKTLKCPEAASVVPEKQLSDRPGLWSEPFAFNKFATAQAVSKLSITDHRKPPVYTAIFSSSSQTNMFYFLFLNKVRQLPGEIQSSKADQ